MIRIENICKSFDGTQVLFDISASFERGKTNLIIGKSGSGKTVLVKTIIGLLPVDSGNVFYGDDNFTEMNFKQRKHIRMQIGMLFQGGALFDSLNVEKNIMFPLQMFTNLTLKEKLARVDECLDRVNLAGANKRNTGELSGGMRKRVGIARAIVMRPKYLFCDEPNSGLDPKTALVIDQLIKEITIDYDITTIINTHDMNSVMEIGENIIFLHNGHCAWRGNRKEVLRSDHEELESFIFASDFLKKARAAILAEK